MSVKQEEKIREYCLSLPHTHEDHPWDHSAFKVNKKTFVFMSANHEGLKLSVKLINSRKAALKLPGAEPTHYGLGKHGWVSICFGPKDKLSLEEVKKWIEESFRAIAPKTIVRDFDSGTSKERVRTTSKLENEILKKMRLACLDWPETSEIKAWGHPNFRAGSKTFAVLETYKLWVAYRQPLCYHLKMNILEAIQKSINRVGIKEVARRAKLSPSTVSRIHAGLINPSFEVIERISEALGFQLELLPDRRIVSTSRLPFVKDILGRLRNELRELGVRHAVVFGSVARRGDTRDSDIDIFLDFGLTQPVVKKMLKAEGRIIEAFGQNKVDVVSQLDSKRGQRLKLQIEKDGIRVF